MIFGTDVHHIKAVDVFEALKLPNRYGLSSPHVLAANCNEA